MIINTYNGIGGQMLHLAIDSQCRVLFDTRGGPEIAEDHIPGAINIEFTALGVAECLNARRNSRWISAFVGTD